MLGRPRRSRLDRRPAHFLPIRGIHLIYQEPTSGHGRRGKQQEGRRHRRGDRGQQPRVPPHAPRRHRHHDDRQGPAAEPRRLDRARLELHLPRRSLEGDDVADAREHASVQGSRGVRRERRDRDRPQRGADAGADAPRRVRQVVGDRARRVAHPAAGQGQSPVHKRAADPRRVLHPRRRCRRLAPRRHDHARARPGGGHEGLREHRGPRDRCRERSRHPREDHQRRLRRRPHRDRMRRLEPENRPHGRRFDPAHADGPPDDRHRARRPGSRTPRA